MMHPCTRWFSLGARRRRVGGAPLAAALVALPGCPQPEDTDDTEAPTCAELAPLGETLSLDPDGPSTQIHVSTAFDGEGLWVAYDLPGVGGAFDVQVLRLSCDGTVDVPRQRASEGDINQLDPAIAVSGGRVLVAWQSDNGVFPDNLDVHYRVYDTDGTALGGPIELATLRGGVPATGSAWMPAVAGLAAGGFALVGAWAHDDSTGFQAFGQVLDADGALVGESWDWDLQADRGQVEPTVAVAGDGAVHAAWREDQTTGASRVVQAQWTEAGGVTGIAAVSGGDDGGGPRLAAAEGPAWLAFSGSDGPMVVPPGGSAVVLGGRGDHSPALAAGSDGALVAWYRNLSGLKNDVRYAWVGSDGTLTGETAVGSADAAPYPLSVTPLGDGLYFVAWQEGDSPDFMLRGRFVAP